MLFSDKLDLKKHYVVAYSGGIDSTALAHFLAVKYQYQLNLTLLHVDPGYPQKRNLMRHACIKQFASDIKAPLHIVYGYLQKTNLLSHRNIKYQALKRLTGANTVALTAHHLDDQLSTMLLKIARSSNPLSWTMPGLRVFGSGSLWRPLLKTTKQELYSYIIKEKLNYYEDSDNSDMRFKRNLMNTKALPALQEISSSQNLSKSIEMLQDYNKIVQRAISMTYEKTSCGDHICSKKFSQQPKFYYAEIIRYWLHNTHKIYPSGRIVEATVKAILSSQLNKQDNYVSLSRNSRIAITQNYVKVATD